ncbi:MAG: tetratricopeptide repeat protein [Gemmataceae bacterium]
MSKGIHLLMVLGTFFCLCAFAAGQTRLPPPRPEINQLEIPGNTIERLPPVLDQATFLESDRLRQDSKKRPRFEALSSYALGVVCTEAGRFGEAIEWFEKAARLDPKGIPIYQELIPLFAGMNRAHDAIRACETLLKLDAKSVPTWYQYSRQLRTLGKTKQAIAALEKAFALLDAKKHPDLTGKDDEGVLTLQINIELGELYSDDEKYKKAVAAFRTCSQILEKALTNPGLGRSERMKLAAKTAAIYEQVGRLTTTNEPKQAIAAYRRAQEVYPEGSHRWNLNLAEVYAATDQNAKALECLDRYLLFLPQRIEPYDLKIKLLRLKNRHKEIIPWLEKAGKKDRFNTRLQLLLANELAKGGRAEQAETLYKKLAKTNPNKAVYRGLFGLYQASSEFGAKRILTTLDTTIAKAEDEADIVASTAAKSQAQAMLQAVRSDKTLAKALVQSARPLLHPKHTFGVRTILLLAVLAEQLGDYEGAEFLYRRLLRRAPKAMEPVTVDGLLRMLGRQYKHQDVVDVCSEAIRNARSLNESLLRARMANALGRLGRIEEALAEADRAIRFAGSSSLLTMQGLRIRLLAQTGKTQEAIKDSKALLEQYQDPDDRNTIRSLLSHVYTLAGDILGAEDQLQLVLKVDPNNAGACNDLGYLWADRNKNLDKAEQLIRKAIKLDQQERTMFRATGEEVSEPNAAYIDSLGWVLFRRGKFKEARIELERAVGLPGGDDPVIWDHLGDVYHQLDQTQQALQAWEKAITLYDVARARKKDHRYQVLREKLRQAQERHERGKGKREEKNVFPLRFPLEETTPPEETTWQGIPIGRTSFGRNRRSIKNVANSLENSAAPSWWPLVTAGATRR